MSVAFFRPGRPGLGLAGVVIGLSLASAAPAQPAQTVESAQQFLSITLPGARYLSGGLMDTLYKSARDSGRAANNIHFRGNGLILEYKPASRCQSTFKIDYSDLRLSGDSSVLPSSFRPLAGYADFTIITGVTASGSTVSLAVKGNSRPSIVYLSSEGMAARVAVAYEFLRINCDPASGTGF